jgi:type II secretory pathway pseudopilin PulG
MQPPDLQEGVGVVVVVVLVVVVAAVVVPPAVQYEHE